MTTFILLVIFVIIGSAFFSGMEAALFSVPQSKVHMFVEQEKRGAQALLKIKENLSQAIVIIVIGNNIVNIIGSIFVGVLASRVFGDMWIGLISALLTFLIIIFGEILPKTIGENHAGKISLRVAPFILFLIKIFYPLVWVIERMTNRFKTPTRTP